MSPLYGSIEGEPKLVAFWLEKTVHPNISLKVMHEGTNSVVPNFTRENWKRKRMGKKKRVVATTPATEAEETPAPAENEDPQPDPPKKLKTWCLPEVKEWTLPPEVLF